MFLPWGSSPPYFVEKFNLEESVNGNAELISMHIFGR